MSARSPLVAAALGLALIAPAPADAALKRCPPVIDVFDGTRYAGSDLYRIRARGVSCRTARRVALRGTYRGVAAVPDPDGRVRVTYRKWTVIGDLRGDADRYRARATGAKRVNWIFGDLR
jgi:hypothetical protein